MRRALATTTRMATWIATLACLGATAPVAQMIPCDSATCEPLTATQPPHQSCDELLAKVKEPARFIANGQIHLGAYEELVAAWLKNLCYRSVGEGGKYTWERDANARDTGPYLAQTVNGQLEPLSPSKMTHAVARIWYSDDMIAWMRTYRPADCGGPEAPEKCRELGAEPPPNGAIVVKEMWKPPVSRYLGDCFDCKSPFASDGSGAVIFVRDDASFSSGWFTGWYGPGWQNDWPPGPGNSFPAMGQGGAQYCINCHASTEPGNTFVSMKNLATGTGGFLSQLIADAAPPESRHAVVALPQDRLVRLGEPLYHYDGQFTELFDLPAAPDWQGVAEMPSRTFDNVLVPGGDRPLDHFLTSSQCVGCHQANATGLQFDMFISNPFSADGDAAADANDSVAQRYGDLPVSVSPYSLWSTSPMGLGGRDPIFFSQLESEQVLHADLPRKLNGKHLGKKERERLRLVIQDTCLTCHGNMAERQLALDSDCRELLARGTANASPIAAGGHGMSAHSLESWERRSKEAKYGALARDGISCTTCHHLRPGSDDEYPAGNRCIKLKQKALNPTQTDLAATFTGTFEIGPPDQIYGQYPEPRTMPMQNALRAQPVHYAEIQQSEMCASCHTIHLPVLDAPIAGCKPDLYSDDPFACFPKRYEQTTYPEWLFSAFRTDEWGGVGPGETPRSCQDCHMPKEDDAGRPYESKIAAIEEFSNYPATDYRLPPEEIDLPVRDSYARHYLVGLNVFFVKMAQQFPDVLGIPTADQGTGPDVPPLIITEQAMLDQAANDTAKIRVESIWEDGADGGQGTLLAEVAVENLVGHKFPSGVSFRRAFIELSVMDEDEKLLWASGRTNDLGVIVDDAGDPVSGEFWWQPDCSARLADPRPHQPHFETITAQDQAQIYQELYTDNSEPFRLTTSFLSIGVDRPLGWHVKDNRLQPRGFLPEAERYKIAMSLGDKTQIPDPTGKDENFGSDAAVGPHGRATTDPDYQNGTGVDRLLYEIRLDAKPAFVRARLFYQAIPPFFLQDRFCISQQARGTSTTDTERLYFLAGHLNLDDTEAQSWKLQIADSGKTMP